MALVGENSNRANIRIEIKNDFTVKAGIAKIDEEKNILSDEDVEMEDGEINDISDKIDGPIETKSLFSNPNIVTNRNFNQWSNNDGGFTTGVDIFDEKEQEKLRARADRFGLDPSECKAMTNQQLNDLHESLGITTTDIIHTRFEVIHMHGTREMSTKDVFAYFEKYGPASIEWINDESCNIVWLDEVSAARAIYGMSKKISGMPATGSCNPFQTDLENTSETKGRSILLVNKGSEIIDVDKNEEIVDISKINIPIPPGYWRLGEPHPKAKCILLRYAKRSDKKPYKAERFSEYYKKYGNPNYGGMKGLISVTKKKILKNFDDQEKQIVKGNPWGSLAKNWSKDKLERPTEEDTEIPHQPKVNKSILNRLGTTGIKRPLVSLKESDNELSDNEPVVKKSKVPRMRMYADEEEAKIEKAKQLKKIRELEKIEEKMTLVKIPDLRNRIGRQSNKLLYSDRISETANLIRRPIKQEIIVQARNDNIQSDLSEEDEDLNVQQRSKVTVVVKKPIKPTVASTIWSRLDREKRNKQRKMQGRKLDRETSESASDSKSSDTSSSESDTESDDNNSTKKIYNRKTLTQRPGFHRDLKSRLGLNTDHKSPLRIEISNDHYKKS